MGEEKKREPFTADGVFVIDKPAGWTSHDVVARVRRILRTRRVGHTGTLDPFATGVLVVCVNRATRLVQFLTGDDKEYLATARFGFATDTGDLTGTALGPVASADSVNIERLQEALGQFRGRIAQVPPMYSAKKIGGAKLYEMARRGETVARQPVQVEIKELELCAWAEGARSADDSTPIVLRENADGTRDADFRVRCSSGTYIRALAEEIGAHLGVGAHLARLRRTQAGRCSLATALTLEELESLAVAGNASRAMRAMADALDLPEAAVSRDERRMLLHGRALHSAQAYADQEYVKLTDHGALLAIARYAASTNSLKPCAVLAADPFSSTS